MNAQPTSVRIVSQYPGLLEQSRKVLADVEKANPAFTRGQAIDWTIEGMSEGWELPPMACSALRAELHK